MKKPITSQHQFDSPLPIEQCVARLKLLSKGNVWGIGSIHTSLHAVKSDRIEFKIHQWILLTPLVAADGILEIRTASSTQVQFQASFIWPVWFFMFAWVLWVIAIGLSGLVQGRGDQIYIMLIFLGIGAFIARIWWRWVDQLAAKITRYLTQP
jgi:hypothetical protein